jgi:predicted outer membrane repeat protein
LTLRTQRPPLLRRIFAKDLPSILVLAICFTCTSIARADAVVTLCQTADQAGSGTNLQAALTASPDIATKVNMITFQCPGSATIQVGSPLEIFQATKIDGGNNITLLGTNTKSLIVVANPGNPLYLYNLTLRHPTAQSLHCINWPKSGCDGRVVSGQGVTELHNVHVDSTTNPIAVTSGTLAVYDSQFTGNSTAVIVAAPGVTFTTITRSVFQNNSGPPIQAVGQINITDSRFINNDHVELVGCQVTIDRSFFQANHGNPGGALEVGCDSTISHTLFTNNAAGGFGGAIVFFPGARAMTLRDDKFLNNTAGPGGGAVSWWAPNTSSGGLNILYSTFTGNRATAGGAVNIPSFASAGNHSIHAGVTYFSGNVATGSGGAISAVSTQLQTARVGFAKNKAGGNGGAVFLSNALSLHSVFANTVFARNEAASGSAFYGDDADFINSTVDSNSGLAIANQAPHQPVHIKLTNSIVSNNQRGGCGPAGLFDDGGHNLQFPGSDCGASISVANPQLDPMWIPLANSPALGNGNVSVCVSPPVNGRDVYGVGRPTAGLCATGAAEREVPASLSQRKGLPGRCDCGPNLLQQLLQLLPFGR